MTTAVDWFKKADANGSADGAFALAELTYSGRIAGGRVEALRLYRVSAERYLAEYQADTLSTQGKIQGNYAQPPWSRYARVLMGPQMTGEDKAEALKYAGRFEKEAIEAVQRKRAYKIDEVKQLTGVRGSMSNEDAVLQLVCGVARIGIRSNGLSVAGVAAAVAGYGVSVEDAFTWTCPPIRDTLGRIMAASGRPFHQIFQYKRDHGISSYESLGDLNLLAMYLVWTRGNYAALEKVYAAKSASGETLGQMISSEFLSAVDAAAQDEVKFRKAYGEMPAQLARDFRVQYVGDEPQLPMPLHLVNVQTPMFHYCASRESSYRNKRQLPELFRRLVKEAGGEETPEASYVKHCLEEPDYLAKLSRLEPYFEHYDRFHRYKGNSGVRDRLMGLARMLRDVCDYQSFIGPAPSYCRTDTDNLIARVSYWTDNSRSGFAETSVHEILVTSMQ